MDSPENDPAWSRWTHKEIGSPFTPISNFFLDNYHQLELTSSEAMLVIQLMKHRWKDGQLSRIGSAKLATRLGLSRRQVFNLVQSLEAKHLLSRARVEAGRANEYDLQPLVDRLMSLFEEAQKEVA